MGPHMAGEFELFWVDLRGQRVKIRVMSLDSYVYSKYIERGNYLNLDELPYSDLPFLNGLLGS